MTRTQHVPIAAALIVSLMGGPSAGLLFASENDRALDQGPGTPSVNHSQAKSLETASAVFVPLAASQKDLLPGRSFPHAGSRIVQIDGSLMGDSLAEAASARAWQDTFHFIPAESSDFAQRGGYYGRRRGSRDGGAAAAIIIGAAASITGAALLVYANRPECSSTDHLGSGCGYGTKVVGGALLTGGLVGVTVGALAWR
jgi:hypothetical protein